MKTHNILKSLMLLLALSSTAHLAFGGSLRRVLQENTCATAVGPNNAWACDQCKASNIVLNGGDGCSQCVIDRASNNQAWMCSQRCYNKMYAPNKAVGNACSRCVSQAADPTQCGECMVAAADLATKSDKELNNFWIKTAADVCMAAVQTKRELSKNYEYVSCLRSAQNAGEALSCMSCLFLELAPSYKCIDGSYNDPTPSDRCARYGAWYNQQCCANANGSRHKMNSCHACTADASVTGNNSQWACVQCSASPFTKDTQDDCQMCVVAAAASGKHTEWKCQECMSKGTEADAKNCLKNAHAQL